MPQIVKKRRSGWAVLAAAAMIASLLAVGAAPAVAVERNVDDPATWKACLGEAASMDHPFTDVSASTTHGTNINCLAYYGITTGTTADTFAPRDTVTRSQMALFLARSADAANVDLGVTMDEGFVDIDGLSAEKRSAINRLVAKGIMFGDTDDSFDSFDPSTTHFAPYDEVARWEMAMFLFAFLDLALESVLIDEIPNRVEGNNDGIGHIELNDTDGDGRGTPVDDYFRDARRETPAHVDDAIGALYELGVTTGVNGNVGELGVFDPYGLVTREQMASFIMRTLGHTHLRPAGVTAQSTATRTQVSVRNADFDPIVGRPVEVISSSYPDLAFDSDGECVTDPPYVTDIFPSIDPCRIDSYDDETDADGNQVFDVGLGGAGNSIQIDCSGNPGAVPDETFSLLVTASPDTHVWAWEGDVGDTVDDATKLALAEPANTVDEVSAPTQAAISGGSKNHVRMGNTVVYVVQLLDKNGNPAGPLPGEDYSFEVTLVATQQATTAGAPSSDDLDPTDPNTQRDGETNVFVLERIRDPKPYHPDHNGKFTVPTSYADPGRFENDPDVKIQLEIRRSAANEMVIVDNTGGEAISEQIPNIDVVIGTKTPLVRFSDNAPYANTIGAETSVWRLLNPNGTNRNTVRLTVIDQYGGPLKDRNGREDLTTDDYYVDATSDVAGDFGRSSITGQKYFPLSNTGQESLGYSRDSRTSPPGPIEETLTVRGSEIAGGLGVAVGSMIVDPPGPPPGRTITDVEATDEQTEMSAKVLWADKATWATRTLRTTYGTPSGTELPVVLLVPGSNYLIVHQPVADVNAGAATKHNGYSISGVETAAGVTLRPMAYRYGEDDAFFVEGVAVTYDQFQQVIGSPRVTIDRLNTNNRVLEDMETPEDDAITTLTWDRFDYGQPEDRAVWRIEGLQCKPLT